jgi:hypothetical protein
MTRKPLSPYIPSEVRDIWILSPSHRNFEPSDGATKFSDYLVRCDRQGRAIYGPRSQTLVIFLSNLKKWTLLRCIF